MLHQLVVIHWKKKKENNWKRAEVEGYSLLLNVRPLCIHLLVQKYSKLRKKRLNKRETCVCCVCYLNWNWMKNPKLNPEFFNLIVTDCHWNWIFVEIDVSMGLVTCLYDNVLTLTCTHTLVYTKIYLYAGLTDWPVERSYRSQRRNRKFQRKKLKQS